MLKWGFATAPNRLRVLVYFFIYLSLLLCMNEQLTINLAFVYASNTYEVILCLMSHFANEGNLSNMSHPLPQNFPCFMLKQNRASDKKKEKKKAFVYMVQMNIIYL